jgi:predicted nucleotide-binding protein (sugar kinase/HSP70/actin superfamily)
VVVGRPYVLYDPAVNAHISKKIRDLGILPIPQDFLPLTEERVSDSWPNVASRQIQRKLAAARIIRRDRRLRAVVLTYFGCGPDSFANPFFRDELGEPCYVMQIDEHTADAGVVTRIEAFSDTAHRAQNARTARADPYRRAALHADGGTPTLDSLRLRRHAPVCRRAARLWRQCVCAAALPPIPT